MIACLFLIARYLTIRISFHKAADHADKAFDFKEGLISALSFHRAGKRDGIFALQRAQSAEMVKRADISNVRFRTRRSLLISSVILLLASAWLCTFPDSPMVIAAKQEEAETEQKTAEIKKLLNDLAKDLEEKLSEDEKELYEKSMLAQMCEKLETTKSKKDALRQYASLEKKLREMSARFSTKQDERFASEAAKELRKDKATKELANKLAGKKYKQAGAEFKKMELKKTKDPAKARKRFSRLNKASKRMSAASKRMALSQSSLKASADELRENVEEMEESLAKSDCKACKSGKCEKGCLSEKQGSANAKLYRLSKNLSKLDAKKRFLLKLDA